MRRISFFVVALLLVVAASAQSSTAILEKISKYPNHTYPIASTYPSVPLGEIAPAPEGFEPFYTWDDFSNYVESRLKQLDATRDRVLKSHK